MAQTIAGFHVDITRPPTHRDLKSPILWLSQAHALSEAAANVVRNDPNLDHFSIYTKGVCHSQYHAVALMLVGLSLETGLKAMMIIRDGIDSYIEAEKQRRHHRLHELAEFVPGLSDKDLGILEALTHFIYWAGKYPDPGSGRENDAVDVFEISERYEITAKDLFSLSARILNHAETLLA
tara:strand:+ start:29414 stop:29953 length:540 start_codon:yes stop_codon:yes gene_type:complete